MDIPLIVSFWLMIAAYVVHVLDESLLEEALSRRFSNIGGRNTLGQSSSGLTPATLSS